MVTRAWLAERFWTSTIRGLRNPDCGIVVPLTAVLFDYAPDCFAQLFRLLRIQFDDQALVDRGGQVGAGRHGLERALEPLRVDLQPLRKAARLRGFGSRLDAQLLLR